MAVLASDPSESRADYETDFLRVLNNQNKPTSDDPKIVRQRGFVVLVRGTSSLKPIQKLCFDKRQTYNDCMTARYRVQSRSAIGSLIMALLFDLEKMLLNQSDLHGEIEPPPSDDSWKELAKSVLKLHEVTSMQKGIFAPSQIKQICDSWKKLDTGQRLVLFGEISGETAELDEWNAAKEILFPELPERVGIVFSGAPADFHFPTDDPHFLEFTVAQQERLETDGPAQSAYKYIDSSFHRDEPANKDQLHVADYANALARFIMHPQTKPPLTIGIHGPWGRGKSSFMKLVDSALVKYAESNRTTRTQLWNDLVNKLIATEEKLQGGVVEKNMQEEYEANQNKEARLWQEMRQNAERNVVGVTFNAWQFEDATQTWAGLASQISARLEATLPWHSRQWLRICYAWKERKTELILNMLLPLAVLCIVVPLVVLGVFRNLIPPSEIDQPLGVLLQILLPAGSALFTIWLLSSQILKVVTPVSERVLSYVRMPDYREQMGFQHRVRDDLQFVYRFLTARRPGCRVVVYIDDLDRCSEDKIMELLQATNLILASCEFFVFVGMDTEMIYRAIKTHYKETPTERTPESYLRKIIQISFFLQGQIPRAEYLSTLFSSKARFDLANRQRQNEGQSAAATVRDPNAVAALPYDLNNLLEIVSLQLEEVEDTPDELQAFCDYEQFLEDNPREIKRLINIHRLTKILLQTQDITWSIKRQRKLVKWLIFCNRWPQLVDDVLAQTLESPDVLGDLARALTDMAEPPDLTRLKEFAGFSKTQAGPVLDALSSRDLDADFRKAANLSQLISESPALVDKDPSARQVVTSPVGK